MGNCYAAEVANTVVVQHFGGKIERLYCPTTAAEVMKANPGHHVDLVTLSMAVQLEEDGTRVKFTRARLLRPEDVLMIGRVYRLVTSKEVTKALMAGKDERAAMNLKKREEMENTSVDQSVGGRLNIHGRHGRPVAAIAAKHFTVWNLSDEDQVAVS